MMNGTISHLGNDLMCDSKVLAIALGRVKRENWKKNYLNMSVGLLQ